MSEAKFTKGKWSPYIGDCDTQEIKCDGKTVISWQGFDGLIIDESEKIANANLVARAPNLYHALKRTTEELAFIIDRYNKKVKDPADFIDAETCHLNQIELAKARGDHD